VSFNDHLRSTFLERRRRATPPLSPKQAQQRDERERQAREALEAEEQREREQQARADRLLKQGQKALARRRRPWA
jgi:hypothetical protein